MADITAAATAVARRSTGAGSDIWRKLAPYLFLLPFLIVFIGFLVVPLVYAFNLSVWKTTLVGGTHFVGFDNYAKAIVDAKFWGGVLTLLKFAAMQIPVMLALALLFALILDSARWARCRRSSSAAGAGALRGLQEQVGLRAPADRPTARWPAGRTTRLTSLLADAFFSSFSIHEPWLRR